MGKHRKNLEMTSLQKEMREEMREIVSHGNIDINVLLDTMLGYIPLGTNRTMYMKELLSLLRSGKFGGESIEVHKRAPRPVSEPVAVKAVVPVRSIPQAVLPIEDMQFGSGVRFPLVTKKVNLVQEFNYLVELNPLQELISRKVFVEGIQSPNEVRVNQLASNPEVLAFLRKQVDFVFTTVKNAKESIVAKHLSMLCPNCKKPMDHWEKKGEKEEIIFVYEGAGAAKRGTPLVAYHKSCLIMDFGNFRGADAEDDED